jgi:hypothetical protein
LHWNAVRIKRIVLVADIGYRGAAKRDFFFVEEGKLDGKEIAWRFAGEQWMDLRSSSTTPERAMYAGHRTECVVSGRFDGR